MLVFLHEPYHREVDINGPEHQVMWAVPSDGQSHRVVSMYQLWYILGPICLLVLIKLPYHVHKHLVNSLKLSVGVSMVRWSSNHPYARELTQLFNDITFKIGALITQELGCGSEEWDVSLPQKSSNDLCSLVGGQIRHDMFCTVITENQNAHHVWWLVQLCSHLSACEVYV